MKKILGVSITAMLAVCPILANAETVTSAVNVTYTQPTNDNSAPTATADPKYAHVVIDTADQGHIASTAYVKGAYNTAITAINKVATTAAAGQTAEQVSSAISTALAAADGDGLTDNGSGALNVNTGAGLKIGTGADADKVMANVDGTTIATDSSTGVLKVGTIQTANIASNAVDTNKIADGAVDRIKIADGAIVIDKIATSELASATANSTYASETGSTKLAQKGYVDEAIAAAGGQTAQQVEDKIDGAAGDGLATNGSGVLSVDTGNGLGINSTSKKVEAKLTTNGGLEFAGTDGAQTIGVKVDTTTIEKNSSTGALQVKSGVFDASGAAAAVETKLTTGGGLTGYDINAKTLQIQGSSVATQDGVRGTIAASTIAVPVFTTWGSDTTAGGTVQGTITAGAWTGTAPAAN